jgi:hypothetical protein
MDFEWQLGLEKRQNNIIKHSLEARVGSLIVEVKKLQK